jgi:hypothetical protein
MSVSLPAWADQRFVPAPPIDQVIAASPRMCDASSPRACCSASPVIVSHRAAPKALVAQLRGQRVSEGGAPRRNDAIEAVRSAPMVFW